MNVNVDKIYRIICTDSYQQSMAETCWTKNKQACIDYINKSYYKHSLHIEEEMLCDETVLKIK